MDYRILNLLFRFSKEFSHAQIRSRELTDTECMISSYIFSHAECSQDEVSSALKTDKTTIGKALAALEQKGCVSRMQDAKDKRVKRLTLTPAGRERVACLVDVHDKWLSEILTALSPEEQSSFEDYCKRLLAAAERLSNEEKTEVPQK